MKPHGWFMGFIPFLPGESANKKRKERLEACLLGEECPSAPKETIFTHTHEGNGFKKSLIPVA